MASSGSSINSRGRETREFVPHEDDIEIRAVLALATPQERAQWEAIRHPITHRIVQNGRPKAKTGDMLIHGERKFIIQGVDEPGELGLATIYYAEERLDV